MKISPVARERRHTLHFLNEIRPFAPVFLDTDIDMTAIRDHRAAAQAGGSRYSFVAYLLHVAARVLAAHPEANASIQGRIRPRVAKHSSVTGKLTLDRTLNGHRVVLAALLPDLHQASLGDVQRQIDHYRDGDPEVMPEFDRVRTLQRLRWPLGALAVRLGARPLRRREKSYGTFAVTSLGHSPVDGFYSVGGTTITLGAGRVADRPVARDGQVVIAPVMRLCLTFDHRVIDGAEAADVLADIKHGLEGYE
jgi:pyruvate/2-oxoglutarate dehydrogenase complex dihydrolipoamide acyltransferase (E2) component